jgi:hypothetical protein
MALNPAFSLTAKANSPDKAMTRSTLGRTFGTIGSAVPPVVAIGAGLIESDIVSF